MHKYQRYYHTLSKTFPGTYEPGFRLLSLKLIYVNLNEFFSSKNKKFILPVIIASGLQNPRSVILALLVESSYLINKNII